MARFPRIALTDGGKCAAVLAFVGLLAPVSLVACSQTVPAKIDAVRPSRVAAGATAQLLVSGDGFQLDDRVWLGATPLAASTWVSGQLLSATLPSLGPGTYDLAVAGTNGTRTRMQGAVIVLPSPTVTQRPSPSPAPAVRSALPSPAPVETRPIVSNSVTALDVTGHWRLTDTIEGAPRSLPPFVFDDVTLTQSGEQVLGAGSGIVSLRGTFTGHTLAANYTAYDGTKGEFIWTFSGSGTNFAGTFTSTAPNRGNSDGVLLRAGR